VVIGSKDDFQRKRQRLMFRDIRICGHPVQQFLPGNAVRIEAAVYSIAQEKYIFHMNPSPQSALS
jgi:hypothetical protein